MQDVRLPSVVQKKIPKVVIVGAGFGGMYVAKNLIKAVKERKIELSIINEKNYFLFTPLLHEVATGGLSPLSVTEPLREVFSGTPISIYQGHVTEINDKLKKIKIGECNFSYDYLVVATGAKTNYFGTPGATEFAYPIKSLENALMVRRKIIDAFEEANSELHEEERKKHLSFVIVGGGPTGVEVAGEVLEFAEKIYKRYFKKNPRVKLKDISVKIINSGPKLLAGLDERVQNLAERELKKKGVQIISNKKVVEVSKLGVKLSDGMMVTSSTVIWSGGVSATFPQLLETVLKEGSRINVDERLLLEGSNSIFVLGDVSSFKEKDGAVLPALAQVAVGEARVVAKNILRSLEKKPLLNFRYVSKGFLASIGRWQAIAKIGPLVFHGKLAWFIWRTVYLFKFISFKKKIRIIFEWTVNVFFPRDITRIN